MPRVTPRLALPLCAALAAVLAGCAAPKAAFEKEDFAQNDTYFLIMLHVAAVVAWLGGSLFVSLFLLSSQPPDSDEAPKERKMLGALRRWTLFVTTPATALAWLVGLHLAVTFGWFAMDWLWIKVGVALALSALLGIQSAALRRLAKGGTRRPPLVDLYAPFTVIAAAVIVTLVVVKPF